MATLGAELERSVTDVNELAAAALGGASGSDAGGNPVPAIVRILNNQLQALTQVRLNDVQIVFERLRWGCRAPFCGEATNCPDGCRHSVLDCFDVAA